MSDDSTTVKKRAAKPAWHQAVSQYAKPDRRKAVWQLVNTFVPYVGLWVLMVYTIRAGYSYWFAPAASSHSSYGGVLLGLGIQVKL